MVFNNYDWTVSVTELMNELDLDPLSLRRKTSHLVTLHKAIGDHLAPPVHSYLTPTQSTTHRSSNIKSYIQQQTCVSSFSKFSFVPCTTRDWNELPTNRDQRSQPIQRSSSETSKSQRNQHQRLINHTCAHSPGSS